MDKIGNLGDVKTGAFYTRANWGKADHPNIWETTNHIKRKIDFILKDFNWEVLNYSTQQQIVVLLDDERAKLVKRYANEDFMNQLQALDEAEKCMENEKCITDYFNKEQPACMKTPRCENNMRKCFSN